MQAASAQGEDMSGLLDVAAEARQISGPHGEVARMVPFTRLLAARHDAAARFRAARPFAHVVLDELFDERVLDRLAAHDAAAARRPDVGSLGDPPSYPDAFIRQLGSEPVLDWLREVTGIEDLVAAPDLHGSSLDPDLHADGLRHPSLPLVRRLVLVIHVARGGEPDGGEPDGGGGLERLGADGAAQDAIIAPRFNRAVLFEAGAAAGPTHAAALRRPDGTGCRAVSIAYWSPDPTARPDLAAGRRARRAQAGAQGGPPNGTDGLSLARSLVEPLARHLRAVLGRST
jgi:hypothetical protein